MELSDSARLFEVGTLWVLEIGTLWGSCGRFGRE
jgi:hypothetical protein